MTDVDRPAFVNIFRELVTTFTRKFDADQAGTYFTALEGVPLAHVAAGAKTLIKASKFWPKPVEWLHAAQEAHASERQTRTMPRPATLEDGSSETTYYCATCADTGWRPNCGCPLTYLNQSHRCPDHPFVKYEMPYPEPLRPCACRGSNPAWQSNHTVRYAPTEQA